MRRFDLKDELRATADRRKTADGAASSQLRGESVQQMASRFAVMFPGLPEDVVEAVLSELFRADATITREALADRATFALIEMSLADGSPQVITSFEPPSLVDDATVQIPVEPMAASVTPSAPPFREIEMYSKAVTPSEQVPSTDIEMYSKAVTPSEQVPSTGCSSEQALQQAPACLDANVDELLDAQLALLLALPDDALSACVQTLASILDRIVDDPGNARVRRLRHGNKAFAAKVGCHEAAVDLLRVAGFEDDPGDNEDDRGMVFCGDHSELSAFGRVRDSIHGIAEDMKIFPQPAKAVSAPISVENAASRDAQRSRTAALTEQRLRNPRQFRQEALERGAANKANGGIIAKRPKAAQNESLTPQRQSQHFNLDDINRMRIDEEIAGTTNYADEYQRTRQSNPAHDYSTLVARSYDPELISRQALDGTNRYRASKGLAPCRWNEGIARIAAEHAESMASGAAPFSHDGFNARVARFPVVQRGAGENLALSSGVANVAETAVNGWIKSPGHEKNLRGNWNVCGIGSARSANGTFYTTQLFANCL